MSLLAQPSGLDLVSVDTEVSRDGTTYVKVLTVADCPVTLTSHEVARLVVELTSIPAQCDRRHCGLYAIDRGECIEHAQVTPEARTEGLS